MAANGVTNVQVARMSAEEFVEAHAQLRRFRRLEEAGIDLGDAGGYRLETLFVDPPRAGLDAASRGLALALTLPLTYPTLTLTLARQAAASRRALSGSCMCRATPRRSHAT